MVGLGPGSGFQLLERASVELPARPAERIDVAADDGGVWAVCILPDGAQMHELWCRADEIPDERWLTVAQTIEVDPELALSSTPASTAASCCRSRAWR